MFKTGLIFLPFMMTALAFGQDRFEADTIKTPAGDLQITFVGHATLIFKFNKLIIYTDPFGKLADYSKLPKADLILVTHEHQDHLDLKAIEAIRTPTTRLVVSESCASAVKDAVAMKNGTEKTVLGVKIEAVPAYNLVHKRENGLPFHSRGDGNGYVLTFGDKRVYVAGDTENIPEMKNLKNIDLAFLPMNLPYTMTPEMVFSAVSLFHPKILYPYHYGETDTGKLLELMKNAKGTEIRIRKMK